MKNLSKGSVWRKWDLHIHSQYSEEKRAKLSVEEIFRKAIKNNIEVIAITDHSNVNGLDKIWKFWEKGSIRINGKVEKISNLINFLPAVELKSAKGKRGVHFIAIFPKKIKNKKVNQKYLEQEFLVKVNCSENDIEESGEGDYRKGLLNHCVPFETTVKAVRTLGGAIIIHAGTKSGGIEKEMAHAKRGANDYEILNSLGPQKNKLMKEYIDICEIPSRSKKNQIEAKFYLEEFGKPTILSSDSHENLKGEKFTWIKANPTFEGLCQIVHEPRLRVRIQKEDPTEFETYPKIEKCVIDFPSDLKIEEENGKEIDFCFQGKQKVNFSNNLTCIIGGHGVGKSTLLHVLYNKLVGDGKLFNTATPLKDLVLTPNPLDKLGKLTVVDGPSGIELFFQNEIEEKAKNLSAMTDLVTKRLETLSKIEEKHFEEKVKEKPSLSNLRQRWTKTFDKLAQLEKSFKKVQQLEGILETLERDEKNLNEQKETISSDEYAKLQENIRKIAEKISLHNKYQLEYKDLISKINFLLEVVKNLKWEKQMGGEILFELEKRIVKDKTKLEGLHKVSTQLFIKKDLKSKIETAKNELKNYLKKKGQSEETIQGLATINEKIENLREEIKSKRKILQITKNDIKKEEKILSDYQFNFRDYYQLYKDACDLLEKRLSKMEFAKKKIKFETRRDEEEIKNKTAQFVYSLLEEAKLNLIGLKSSDFKNVLFQGNKLKLKSLVKQSEENFRKAIEDYSGAVKHKEALRILISKKIYLKRLSLRFFREYYSLENLVIQTKLGENKLLQKTSFGERCKIVIAIILAAGTNPILIDQPEDNLDGNFISKNLVPLIRNVKQNRQIILITRDANIVVGGDSELIHILKNETGKTQIYSGTLENKKRRNDYIDMLEGGKPAFKKRERKYRI